MPLLTQQRLALRTVAYQTHCAEGQILPRGDLVPIALLPGRRFDFSPHDGRRRASRRPSLNVGKLANFSGPNAKTDPPLTDGAKMKSLARKMPDAPDGLKWTKKRHPEAKRRKNPDGA